MRVRAAAALAAVLSSDADERVSNAEQWSASVQRGIAGGREKVKSHFIVRRPSLGPSMHAFSSLLL